MGGMPPTFFKFSIIVIISNLVLIISNSVGIILEQDRCQCLRQEQDSTPAGMLHVLFVLCVRNCWLTSSTFTRIPRCIVEDIMQNHSNLDVLLAMR